MESRIVRPRPSRVLVPANRVLVPLFRTTEEQASPAARQLPPASAPAWEGLGGARKSQPHHSSASTPHASPSSGSVVAEVVEAGDSLALPDPPALPAQVVVSWSSLPWWFYAGGAVVVGSVLFTAWTVWKKVSS